MNYNTKLIYFGLVSCFASFSAQGDDFPFLVKPAGYALESISLKHDLDKAEVVVLRGRGSVPIELKGVFAEGLTRAELIVIFSQSEPLAFIYKKWKQIDHPGLSDEGEISETLVIAKGGDFEDLHKEVEDQRFAEIFQRAVEQASENE